MNDNTNTNFISQCCDYDCGPTAVYNAIMWANPSTPAARAKPLLRRLTRLSQCNPITGTSAAQLQKLLDTVCNDPRTGFRVTNEHSFYKGEQVTWDFLKQHLFNGAAILLDFHWEMPETAYTEAEADEHYVLITEYNPIDKTMLVINPGEFGKDHTGTRLVTKWYTRRGIIEMLRRYDYTDATKYVDPRDWVYPKAWILNKNV